MIGPEVICPQCKKPFRQGNAEKMIVYYERKEIVASRGVAVG